MSRNPSVESLTTLPAAEPPLIGDSENTTTDPDGDSRYEDVDGNGEFDDTDMVVLFENLLRSDPQNYIEVQIK